MRDKGKANDQVIDYVEALRPLGVTKRESEVARLIAFGYGNPDAATELGISVSTVKSHVERLLIKLQVGDRGELSGEVHRVVDAFREEVRRQRRAKPAKLRLVRRRTPTRKRTSDGSDTARPASDA